MDKLIEKVESLRGKNIVVVGDVGLDEYVNGNVKRISPEAPVPVVEVTTEESRLGLATNVAQNISCLGSTCQLVSVVGDDDSGKRLRQLLNAANVSDDNLIVDETRPTTRKLRVMSEHHHLVRVDYEKKKFLSKETAEKIEQKVKEILPSSDGLVLQDYAKGVLDEELTQSLIKLAHQEGKQVVVDPNKFTPLRYYSGADLMTPNLDEAIALSALPLDDLRVPSDALTEVGEKIMEVIQSNKLVITRGKDGMSLFEGGKTTRVPTFAREVFDVTGAGDTVIATLAMSWFSGLNLEESCLIANHAAGVVVGHVGCVPCSYDELIDSISNSPS